MKAMWTLRAIVVGMILAKLYLCENNWLYKGLGWEREVEGKLSDFAYEKMRVLLSDES